MVGRARPGPGGGVGPVRGVGLPPERVVLEPARFLVTHRIGNSTAGLVPQVVNAPLGVQDGFVRKPGMHPTQGVLVHLKRALVPVNGGLMKSRWDSDEKFMLSQLPPLPFGLFTGVRPQIGTPTAR